MVAQDDLDIRGLREHFENWLFHMDDYLDELRAALPDNLRQEMDFSLHSLKQLESWILDRYPDIEAAKAETSGMVNNAAVYLGEVIRKTAGGKWQLMEEENNAFFGLPCLFGINGKHVDCPVTLITAAADRRRGDYLFKVASHLTQQA